MVLPLDDGAHVSATANTHAVTTYSVTYVYWGGHRVKKGRGQRKNKRDRDGRRLHLALCALQRRYPGTYSISLAS